jgi:hypothetical protein
LNKSQLDKLEQPWSLFIFSHYENFTQIEIRWQRHGWRNFVTAQNGLENTVHLSFMLAYIWNLPNHIILFTYLKIQANKILVAWFQTSVAKLIRTVVCFLLGNFPVSELIQTQRNYPKENIQHTEYGKSLKSAIDMNCVTNQRNAVLKTVVIVKTMFSLYFAMWVDRTGHHQAKIYNYFRKVIWSILIIKPNEMHYFSNLFDKALYMFWKSPLSIIRSILTLYTSNRSFSC